VAERLGEAALEDVLGAYAAEGEAASATEGETAGTASVASQGAASGRGAFILDIGTEPGDLGPRLAKLGRRPFLRFSAGLWPGKAAFDDPAGSLSALEADIGTGFCSALGECGLDYHHMEAEPSVQRALFEAQALMAVEAGLPLIVHTRDAFLDTLGVVAEIAGSVPVVIHCFGYGPAEAERFLSAGCLLSFAGNFTYKSAGPIREALAMTPPDRILFETDSPYMNPMPLRGRPSTPLDIGRTIEAAAAFTGRDLASFAASAGDNAFRIFSGRAFGP
jgi:TatD DNase family protein